jgi:hypothetical protein
MVNCEIALKSSNGGATRSAIAKNISGNGLLFMVAEQPDIGDFVEIVVSPGALSIPELSAVVEVIRVENNRKWDYGDAEPAGPCFAVGARIKSMK